MMDVPRPLIKKLERIDNIGIAYYNVIDFVSKEVFKT